MGNVSNHGIVLQTNFVRFGHIWQSFIINSHYLSFSMNSLCNSFSFSLTLLWAVVSIRSSYSRSFSLRFFIVTSETQSEKYRCENDGSLRFYTSGYKSFSSRREYEMNQTLRFTANDSTHFKLNTFKIFQQGSNTSPV